MVSSEKWFEFQHDQIEWQGPCCQDSYLYQLGSYLLYLEQDLYWQPQDHQAQLAIAYSLETNLLFL